MLKPDIFASIMDFFASNVPILTEDQPASDTGDTKYIINNLIVMVFVWLIVHCTLDSAVQVLFLARFYSLCCVIRLSTMYFIS